MPAQQVGYCSLAGNLHQLNLHLGNNQYTLIEQSCSGEMLVL